MGLGSKMVPVVICLFCVIVTGCTTHTPMSESVMFRDQATTYRHESTLAFGLLGAVTAAQGATNDLIERDQRADRREDGVVSNGNLGLYVAAYDPTGSFALSFTAGFPFGFDATAKLWGRNYLTAGYSVTGVNGVRGQAQAFVQHRTFNSRFGAAAIGLGYRHELLDYSVPSENILGGWEAVRVGSVGVRGSMLLRMSGSTQTGLKFGTYTGYIPTVRRPVVSATLTVGGF